jgi:hypothetical protein
MIKIQLPRQQSLLIYVTLHVSNLMDHLQVFLVAHYLLIGLQREIHIPLFTYTGRT